MHINHIARITKEVFQLKEVVIYCPQNDSIALVETSGLLKSFKFLYPPIIDHELLPIASLEKLLNQGFFIELGEL